MRDAIKTLRSPVEISQAYCAVIADLLEALSAKLAERERRAAERERAERLMERLQQESERCDKEVSQRIWADTELQRERERADRNQEDAERYRWLRQYPICLRMWAWTEKLLEKLDAAIDAARRK